MTQAKEPLQKRNSQLTGEKLNFIIAVCAILISAASFYATYLQADAAKKQVKAMTLPMIQYGHGNVNNNDELELNFTLTNAGVGPALIQSLEFIYQNKSYDNFFKILEACCKKISADFAQKLNNPEIDMPQFISSNVVNTIIPAQDELTFLRLEKHPENTIIWNSLNELRFEVGIKACYCSLLDECFETNDKAETQAVKACTQ